MRYGKAELDRIQHQLYTAVIADILDEVGERDFCFSGELRPMGCSGKLAGYARTLYVTDTFTLPEKPYQMDLRFIDSLREGDVPVTRVNGRNHNGYIGELLATACMVRGARGAVLDGHARDTALIDFARFPLFCLGTNPLDSKGRVEAIEADGPVECGGVLVTPGDFIFGDTDGIVRVPAALTEKVISLAMEKVQGENTVRSALLAGESVQAVFDRYGIL